MTDSRETMQQANGDRPHYKRIPRKDSWLRDRHDPTADDKKKWEDAGMPAHIDIIAGFLATNNFIYGVPDNTELFRLHDMTREEKTAPVPRDRRFKNLVKLHYVDLNPIPAPYYTVAHPPIGLGDGDSTEVNYNVRLQGIVRTMLLSDISVESGSRDSEDPNMVFLGTECPGPDVQRQIRVVKITVRTPGSGIWETVSETIYPKSST